VIKIVDLIISMAADSADIFAHPQREREKFEKWHTEAQNKLDAALTEGYTLVSATPASYSGSTSIIYVLYKAPVREVVQLHTPAAAPGSPGKPTEITRMEAGRTKNSASPMWRCVCSDGTKVNIFKHADADKNNFSLFEGAGYAPEMEQLKDGATLDWKTHPVRVTLHKPGDFWEVVQVQPRRKMPNPIRSCPTKSRSSRVAGTLPNNVPGQFPTRKHQDVS